MAIVSKRVGNIGLKKTLIIGSEMATIKPIIRFKKATIIMLFCIPNMGIRTNPPANEPNIAPKVLAEYELPTYFPSLSNSLAQVIMTNGNTPPINMVGMLITMKAKMKRPKMKLNHVGSEKWALMECK